MNICYKCYQEDEDSSLDLIIRYSDKKKRKRNKTNIRRYE